MHTHTHTHTHTDMSVLKRINNKSGDVAVTLMTMAISESLIRYFFFFPFSLFGRGKTFSLFKRGKKRKKGKKTYEYERLRDLKSLESAHIQYFLFF